MNARSYQAYYFVGIGGIGMSALARFFKALGKSVAGYDRTETRLTKELVGEGIRVHYIDELSEIPMEFRDPAACLVIYTPAIPTTLYELRFFRDSNFTIMKRAAVLGELSKQFKAVAVAGTHGKTTVSTMIGHLLHQSSGKQAAILGGIAKNYNSNLLMPNSESTYVVLEADEYDRSMLQLFPQLAVITAIDPDHLDIYGTLEAIYETFGKFIEQIQEYGILLYKHGLQLPNFEHPTLNTYSFGLDEAADFRAKNIRVNGHGHLFDIVGPGLELNDLELNMPGLVNVLNALTASVAAFLAGMPVSEIPAHLASFSGIRRRMEYQFISESCVFIDDYAHHPEELSACISSVRAMYSGKRITGVFQPHLFTRTRDFADGFAESLSLLDEVILLDIYPAREEPIEGVNSAMILDRINTTQKSLVTKADLVEKLRKLEPEVLLTLGAGDIDKLVPAITSMLHEKYSVR